MSERKSAEVEVELLGQRVGAETKTGHHEKPKKGTEAERHGILNLSVGGALRPDGHLVRLTQSGHKAPPT